MSAHRQPPLLVVGAGIGGLAAALAARRAGWPVRLLEQAAELAEVGAGIQLGPNAVRLLESWGLGAALRERACQPQGLAVRDARRGRLLAALPLGQAISARHGAAYLTLHRAALQALLAEAATAGGVAPELGVAIESVAAQAEGVCLTGQNSLKIVGSALVGADGVWSRCRAALPAACAPRFAGHWAWRSLLAPHALPTPALCDQVTVWLAPRLHVVGYPVLAPGAGALAYNLVLLGEAACAPAATGAVGWDHPAPTAQALPLDQLPPMHAGLAALLAAAPSWRAWPLYRLPPLTGPQQMADGPAALLGDAAHAMLPYLAQGAAMALEDAHALGAALAGAGGTPQPAAALQGALARYAQARWRRCAQVQARADRNARVFHAAGPLRLARDAALAALGGRLLDQPWLWRA